MLSRPCPTPGHAHRQELSDPSPASRYVVRTYADHQDSEADLPASRAYYATAAEAEAAERAADAPIVDRLAYAPASPFVRRAMVRELPAKEYGR